MKPHTLLLLFVLGCSTYVDHPESKPLPVTAPDESSGGSGGSGGAKCEPWQDCACDDGDPCTIDTHPPGRCVHAFFCGRT